MNPFASILSLPTQYPMARLTFGRISPLKSAPGYFLGYSHAIAGFDVGRLHIYIVVGNVSDAEFNYITGIDSLNSPGFYVRDPFVPRCSLSSTFEDSAVQVPLSSDVSTKY